MENSEDANNGDCPTKYLDSSTVEFKEALSQISADLLELIDRQFDSKPKDLAVGAIKETRKVRKIDGPETEESAGQFVEDSDTMSEMSDDD